MSVVTLGFGFVVCGPYVSCVSFSLLCSNPLGRHLWIYPASLTIEGLSEWITDQAYQGSLRDFTLDDVTLYTFLLICILSLIEDSISQVNAGLRVDLQPLADLTGSFSFFSSSLSLQENSSPPYGRQT